jgi:hypothetical protein
LALAQLLPLVRKGAQTPAEQKSPLTQSASPTQLPRQALAPQVYGLQPCVCAAGQLPAPSHDAARVATPALQLATRHEPVGYAQAAALEPSHAPPQPLPSEAHACRAPCGAPATLVHVPADAGTSQASHCPVQLELQHTPSTHCPLAHWFAPVQATPSPPCEWQRPAAQ